MSKTMEQGTFLNNDIFHLKEEIVLLRNQNETLRLKEQRLHEAEIKANMFEEQAKELKTIVGLSSPEKQRVQIIDRADFSTPAVKQRMRSDALNARLIEIEKDNLELRRQLAGLTPKTPSFQIVDVENCPGCKALSRQKSHQANYLEDRVLDARRKVVDYRKHCQRLCLELAALKTTLCDIQSKYQKQIDRLGEHATLYKYRSERLEKWNKASLRGFQADIKLIRGKLGNIEKEIVQTQLLCANSE